MPLRNARDAISRCTCTCLNMNSVLIVFPLKILIFFSVKAWKTHSGNRNLAHEVALSF